MFYNQNEMGTKEARHRFLFRYKDIENNFPQIISKWYQFEEQNFPIINSLIESLMPNKYFDNKTFLTVAQALDGYHKRYINKSEGIGFEKRLDQIYEKFSDIKTLQSIKTSLPNAAKSRHYYSHLFKEEKDKILGVQELYQITKDLKKLLTCCVLNEIGLSHELIEANLFWL